MLPSSYKLPFFLFVLLFLLAIITLSIGFFFVSPLMGVVFLIGLMFGLISVFLLLRFTFKNDFSINTSAIFFFIISLFLVGSVAFLVNVGGGTSFYPAPKKERIVQYRATLKPIDFDSNKFILQEEVLVEIQDMEELDKEPQKEAIEFAKREVVGQKKSYVVNEVRFKPLNMDESGSVNISKDETTRLLKFCEFYCPSANIIVLGIPKNSFAEAENPKEIETSAYSDSETISWRAAYPDNGIAFSYYPASKRHFNKVLKPFISVTSFGYLFVTLLGLFVTSTGSLIWITIYTFLNEKTKDWIVSSLKRLFSKPEKEKKKYINEND